MNTTDRKRIVLAGGSGFLGMSLARELLARSYEPIVLTRGPAGVREGIEFVNWDARTAGDWVRVLDGALAVVNQVGKSVNCRKTEENKRIILESRVNSVKALAEGFAKVSQPPGVWIQNSTAHIYGDTDDELLDEHSPIGTGFAPMVGTEWERAFNEAKLPDHTRRLILRISFVIGRGGGALKTLTGLVKWFVGGTVGTGRQYMSWIHEADLNAFILHALEDATVSGTYVVTAPNPVTNREFMKQLRKALHRPWSPPAPWPMVYLGSILLRTDPELALLGRRCVPTRMTAEGFQFKFAHLEEAIKDLFDH